MNYIRKDLDVRTILGAMENEGRYELLLNGNTIVSEEDWHSPKNFQEWCNQTNEYVPNEFQKTIPKGKHVLLNEDDNGKFLLPIDDFELKPYGVTNYFDEKELCPIIVPDDGEWDETIKKSVGLNVPKSLISPFSNYIFWDMLSNKCYETKGYPYVKASDMYDEIEFHNRKHRQPYYIYWGEKDIFVGIVRSSIESIEEINNSDSVSERIDSVLRYLFQCNVEKEIDTFSIVSNDYISQPPGKDHTYYEYKIYKHVNDEYIDSLFPHDKIETDYYRDCVISGRHGEQRIFLDEEAELKKIARSKYDREEHFRFLLTQSMKQFNDNNERLERYYYSSLLNIIQELVTSQKKEVN